MTIIRVIDFETNGIEVPPSEVCEVGMCDLDLEAKTISGPASWMCRVNEMPPEARAVHHITKDDCEPYDPFSVEPLIAGNPTTYAAHNAAFEMKFFAPPTHMICTYKAALRVWPNAPSHSNGALRYWLEDQGLIHPEHTLTQPAHRAGPDAYVTAHILLALFNVGHTGKEMIRWTKEPPLLPKCPLGKFRGKPWSEVEGGFLGWMLRQETMETDLKWNAEREIARRQEMAQCPT
jgi:exodeoxyribonuclease X